MAHLAKNGIHFLGTVRINKILPCNIPKVFVLNKSARGNSDEFVTNFEGTEICNVYCTMTLSSSFMGTDPVKMLFRYDRHCQTITISTWAESIY